MRFRILLVVAALSVAATLHATPVTGIAAVYHDGQTFITWNNLALTGVRYYVYRSLSHIGSTADLASATLLGYVLDSSGNNLRYTFNGAGKRYVIDNSGTTLDTNKGLFVTTVTTNATVYYAVTSRKAGDTEDLTIGSGNSIATGVAESTAPVVPVLQAKFKNAHNDSVYVYTQFLTRTSTAGFPQFTNAGSFPINFGLVKSHVATGGAHPLETKLHGGGGSFNDALDDKIADNLWRLVPDDWIPAFGFGNTAWFGYHENFDILANSHTLPYSGTVRTYTSRRVVFTIDWVITTFTPAVIDSTRLYLVGSSAGAAGSAMLCMLYPAKFAAAQLSVPKFDVSFTTDPDTNANHNPGNPGRRNADTMFGPVDSVNLPTDIPNPNVPGDTLLMYDFGNLGHMAYLHRLRGIPLIFAVNGKRDITVGWAEKIGYYDSIQSNRQGGYYYWDMRTHNGNGGSWNKWQPDLLRYATTISYPAFSKCTLDGDPGDGHATNGDSISSLNGFLDWQDSITDNDTLWTDTLLYRTGMKLGAVTAQPASDSCKAEVTLRRVQRFIPSNGDVISWKVYYQGQVIRSDSYTWHAGPVILPRVPIRRSGVLLEVRLLPQPRTHKAGAPSNAHIGTRLDLK